MADLWPKREASYFRTVSGYSAGKTVGTNVMPTMCKEVQDIKQGLDEVFAISRIMKMVVRVISRSRRMRLITFTETLIILYITKNRI